MLDTARKTSFKTDLARQTGLNSEREKDGGGDSPGAGGAWMENPSEKHQGAGFRPAQPELRGVLLKAGRWSEMEDGGGEYDRISRGRTFAKLTQQDSC